MDDGSDVAVVIAVEKNGSPVLSLLEDVSTIDVFTARDLMKRFLKPKDGKIITLGALD